MLTFTDIKVHYIDRMGTDLTAVNAARISFANESNTLTDKDEKLLNYLAKNEHMSPFEHCVLTVMIECPLYVRSQIQRHRTFSYNEVSRRYTSDGLEFYLPPMDDLRSQSKSNKQASDKALGESEAKEIQVALYNHCRQSLELFEALVGRGLSREQARGILPQCLMTKFYMTGNLRNWAHFIELREHPHAQKEVQGIASAVKKEAIRLWPKTSEALFKHKRSV